MFRTTFLLIPLFLLLTAFNAEAQMPSDSLTYKFSVVEKELLNRWEKDSSSFRTNYSLGILYYNEGVRHIDATGKVSLDFDSIPEAVFNLQKAKIYLDRAHERDSTNKNVIYALEGVTFSLGNKLKGENYVDPQAFRVVEGDTINKIDEIGMLQGEWERLHPDGSFRCRGVYKDNKKDGYWERKWTNGNWQYQVYFENGYPEGYGKWYYKNGVLKSEGNYKKGKADGVCKQYYESGKLSSEETYTAGELDGVCSYYNEETVLKRSGVLNGDKREGEWKFYSDTGVHTSSVIYKDGQAIETIIGK